MFHTHQVDHIVAQKHGGETLAENHALSCISGNQGKDADLSSLDPHTGEFTALFHPRRQRWREHFELRGLFILPETPTGRVTVRLLQLNAPERIAEHEWFAVAGELTEPASKECTCDVMTRSEVKGRLRCF